MKPKPHTATVNHRDAVMKFIISLRQALPHVHIQFVAFLKDMYETAKVAPTRPTNFTTHSRVIRWFVEHRRKDPKNAQHYHTLAMSYIRSIAVHDTLPSESIDFLVYAGYLLS
jgi:hypothetical protein